MWKECKPYRSPRGVATTEASTVYVPSDTLNSTDENQQQMATNVCTQKCKEYPANNLAEKV